MASVWLLWLLCKHLGHKNKWPVEETVVLVGVAEIVPLPVQAEE